MAANLDPSCQTSNVPADRARPVLNARFRIHRVVCPKCGRTFWFTLFSERSPEEVEWARMQQERRLLSEPCDGHTV